MKGLEKERMTLTDYVCVDFEKGINLMFAKVGYTIYFDRLPIFLVLCGLSQNFSDFEQRSASPKSISDHLLLEVLTTPATPSELYNCFSRTVL